jgi:hypothetical protein
MTVVTEEEAKGKWCPHVRIMMGGAANSVAVNRGSSVVRCIGSECMAWRWVKGSEKASVGRGYCGLAGRP